MIQTLPIASLFDSSSAFAGAPATLGADTKAFAAFVVEGLASEPFPMVTGKVPAQTGLLPAQQGAGQAWAMISGADSAPVLPLETMQDGMPQPQLTGAALPSAGPDKTSLVAALPNPIEPLPQQSALTSTPPEANAQPAKTLQTTNAPDLTAASAIRPKTRPGAIAQHAQQTEARASNIEPVPSDALIPNVAAEPAPPAEDPALPLTNADAMPEGTEAAQGDVTTASADAPMVLPQALIGEAAFAAALPERQTSLMDMAQNENLGVETLSASATSEVSSGSEEIRGNKTATSNPDTRQSSAERAAALPEFAENFPTRSDASLVGASAGASESGLKAPVTTVTIAVEAKGQAAQSAAPDIISDRPGEIGRALGVEIARHKAEGRDSLTIRLDPVELGRIHIRMHFDDTGQLRAQVAAESGLALDLLRRDSSELSRALNDAGVRTDAQSFQFESRGQQREQPMPRSPSELAQSERDAAAEDDLITEPSRRKLNPNGALDLFA